jgi:hypothetical protein
MVRFSFITATIALSALSATLAAPVRQESHPFFFRFARFLIHISSFSYNQALTTRDHDLEPELYRRSPLELFRRHCTYEQMGQNKIVAAFEESVTWLCNL